MYKLLQIYLQNKKFTLNECEGIRSHCIMSTNMDIVWNVIFFVLVKKESLMK